MGVNNLRKRLLVVISIVFGIGLAIVLLIGARGPDWSSIHSTIAKDYADVKQLAIDQFLAYQPSDIVIFDVREPEEFAVSHLAGAVRLDPAITPTLFEQRYGKMLANKTALFYCSVGRRSSELASQLQDVLEDNDVNDFYNLSGGIFEWRNQDRVLLDLEQKITKSVHPYNAFWGRLIHDKSAISY